MAPNLGQFPGADVPDQRRRPLQSGASAIHVAEGIFWGRKIDLDPSIQFWVKRSSSKAIRQGSKRVSPNGSGKAGSEGLVPVMTKDHSEPVRFRIGSAHLRDGLSTCSPASYCYPFIAIPLFCRILISTRRFFARPSAVLLLATGLESPYPKGWTKRRKSKLWTSTRY